MSDNRQGGDAGSEQTLTARRTESVDAPIILVLSSDKTHQQFGNVNIVHLIEKANLSVTLCNDKNEVVGFSAFVDYPQTEYQICENNLWENWIPTIDLEILKGCTPMNSLFMHYFTAQQEYADTSTGEIIKAVFNAVHELHFVLLLMKVDSELEPALSSIFTQIHTFKCPGGEFNLYVCQRHNHIPRLHIRKAVVEDTDDLTPLFNKLDSILTKSYGDYFVAETIEAQDKNNHCLAAEYDGKAVGFMSICSSVNLEFVQNCYELEVFHGLAKPHSDDVLVKPSYSSIESNNLSSIPSSEMPPSDEEGSEQENGEQKVKEDPPVTDEVIIEEAVNEDSDTQTGNHDTKRSKTTDYERKLSEEYTYAYTYREVDEDESEEVVQRINVVLNPGLQPNQYEAKKVFRPTYSGSSNAFTIQLFCMEEMHEMRSVDFLPEIFKLFPDKDFAVISLPHLVPEFPLLQNFVRVVPRIGSGSPHELYIFHRDGLLSSNFVVRKERKEDFEKIEKLVDNLVHKERLLDDLVLFNQARRTEEGSEIIAFVAECREQIVGVCVIRDEDEIEYIRSHYNIEDFIYYNHHRRDEHGNLHHFVLSPIFQNFSKMFLKEVLRQGGKSCLYYPVFPNREDPHAVEYSLVSCLHHLVPIRARRQIIYPIDELNENLPSNTVLDEHPSYALNHINRKLTLEPKVVINASIVVVGASDVALSFLEILCFCPHLRFNNLILVSKRGFPTGEFEDIAQTFSKADLARMSLRSWVTVIKGTMVSINRGHKQIGLDDGSSLAYDYLILCTGQQFHVPHPITGVNLSMSTINDLTVYDLYRPYRRNEEIPENVIALNDDADYSRLMDWTKDYVERLDDEDFEEAGPVIVYGNNFQALSTIQLMINCGLPGTQIILMRPSLMSTQITVNDDSDIFNERPISKLITEVLERLEVHVFKRHVLSGWKTRQSTLNEDRTEVTHVSFITDTKPLINFPCAAFISLHPCRIGYDTFTALNDSCITFDGRLTIDADFKTNDPAIRAAGPLVKYSRRYHADKPAFRHENQSSREIGFRLAMSILPIIDPTLEGVVNQEDSTPTGPDEIDLNKKLVPIYHEPKVLKGELPGGFFYVHVRKPGDRSHYELELDKNDHGLEIVTGNVTEGNYFRLHINKYNCVETITCLVSSDNADLMLPFPNLIQLYGVHQRYINDIVQRYNEKLIPDLYAFFRQSWSMVLFHDRFPDLRQEIREILSSAPVGAENLPSIEAMVNSLVDEDLVIDDSQRKLLAKHFENVGQRRSVEKRLLSYLSYNHYHLPMYAKPGMI